VLLLQRAIILFSIFSALHFSCSTSKSTIKQEAQVYNADFQFEDDQVLVLLVELLPGEAKLRRARIVSGTFKPALESLKQKEAVRVQYLDEKDQVLLEKILDHPLYQYKEFSDQKGRLQYVRVEGEKGSLLLRTQYSKAIKSIRIDYGEDNSYRKISEILLDLEEE